MIVLIFPVNVKFSLGKLFSSVPNEKVCNSFCFGISYRVDKTLDLGNRCPGSDAALKPQQAGLKILSVPRNGRPSWGSVSYSHTGGDTRIQKIFFQPGLIGAG